MCVWGCMSLSGFVCGGMGNLGRGSLFSNWTNDGQNGLKKVLPKVCPIHTLKRNVIRCVPLLARVSLNELTDRVQNQ